MIAAHYLVTSSVAQNGRTSAHQDHSGPGWDIRLAVPGEPGSDYPTLGSIPRTSFSCAGKEPGYYADLETNCQAFRVCTIGSTYGFQSFLCPNGTLFNQAVFVCDWWMNVNCQDSERLFNNNNEKFSNLRLGPQLMKDIKKMLTHPMHNPYDRNAMKGNLIVMQDYRPPSGQMFSKTVLNLNLETPLSNVYIPAKQVQSSGRTGYNNDNDIAFAASTPNPRYLPASFNTFQYSTQNDAETFQKQRQNGQYTQSSRQQNTQTRQQGTNKANVQFSDAISNNNIQFTPSTSVSNNGHTQYGQRQINNSRSNQVTNSQYAINYQRGQINQQSATYTSNKNPSRIGNINGKQAEFSIAYSKQQYNAKQEKQPYTYQQPQLQFSSENSKSGFGVKQNLALVFSLLADSINVAKEYNNEQVNTEQSTPTKTRHQTVSDEDITQITNKISDLTSSQFSETNQQKLKSAKIIASNQIPHNNEHSETTTNHLQNTFSSISNKYQTPSTDINSKKVNNIVPNSKQVYSGQLYQLPVPDVTDKVLNQGTFTNNIMSSNADFSKSSESDVEIVKSNSIPQSPVARLETAPTSEVDHFNSQENFDKFIKSNNGISAQIQDKIVGSIPHPLEGNKVVTYKKDESYYVYTKLDNTVEDELNSQTNTIQSNNAVGQQSAKLINENNLPNIVAFQLIPSISYQLEGEQDQDNFLNSFQLDKYGQPKSKINVVDQSTRTDLTSEVDYSIDHTLSQDQVSGQLNDVSKLYSGPSSYSAPQSSVGNLGSKQDYTSRLELENKNNGYSKVVPSIQFSY
ncbi:hypothetical protein ACJJTC_007182 [Scirpophaga incertulas]